MAIDMLYRSMTKDGSISHHKTTSDLEKCFIINWLLNTDPKGLASSAKLGMLGPGCIITGPNSNVLKSSLNKIQQFIGAKTDDILKATNF